MDSTPKSLFSQRAGREDKEEEKQKRRRDKDKAKGTGHQMPVIYSKGRPKYEPLLTLAMGDVRRLMAKVMTRLDAADVEHRAKTGEVPNSDRFIPNEARINTALRDKFPIPTSCMRDMAFELADRKALLEGIPDAVRVQMEDNPLMDDTDAPLWLHHLIRYLEIYRKKAKDRAREGDEAREQLTKLQLAEARAKVNDSKKGKAGRQMVHEQAPVPQPPQPQPVPILGTSPTMSGYGCHYCGDPGHWRRSCPHIWPRATWLWLWPWGLPAP